MDFREWCFERSSNKVQLGLFILAIGYFLVPLIGSWTWSNVSIDIYNVFPLIFWLFQFLKEDKKPAEFCAFSLFTACINLICVYLNYGISTSEENFKYLVFYITSTGILMFLLPYYYEVILGTISIITYLIIMAYTQHGNFFCGFIWILATYIFFGLISFVYERDLKKLWELEIQNQKRVDYDCLTGAKTRYYFQQHAVEEDGKIATSYGVIGMVDIDFFKKFNDDYGHDKGDEVLTRMSEIFQYNLSKSDCFIRWGGEEFIFLLRGKDLEIALERLELIRYQLGLIGISISCGVAQINHNLKAEDNIKIVDSYLYEAKNNGRNRIGTVDGIRFEH